MINDRKLITNSEVDVFEFSTRFSSNRASGVQCDPTIKADWYASRNSRAMGSPVALDPTGRIA